MEIDHSKKRKQAFWATIINHAFEKPPEKIVDAGSFAEDNQFLAALDNDLNLKWITPIFPKGSHFSRLKPNHLVINVKGDVPEAANLSSGPESGPQPVVKAELVRDVGQGFDVFAAYSDRKQKTPLHYKITMPTDSYHLLGYAALNKLANPELGAEYTGSRSVQDYMMQVKDPNSRVGHLITNIITHAGITADDISKLTDTALNAKIEGETPGIVKTGFYEFAQALKQAEQAEVMAYLSGGRQI